MDGRRARSVLGVAADAGPDEIRRAFRARALVTHPDHGGDRRRVRRDRRPRSTSSTTRRPAAASRPLPRLARSTCDAAAPRCAARSRRLRLAAPARAAPRLRRRAAGRDRSPCVSSVRGRGRLGTRGARSDPAHDRVVHVPRRPRSLRRRRRAVRGRRRARSRTASAARGRGPRPRSAAFFGGVGGDVSTHRAARPHATSRRERVGRRRSRPSAARAACYFTVMTGAGVDHWGRYRDDLVPDGDRWLFAHRLVRTDGVTPGGWAATVARPCARSAPTATLTSGVRLDRRAAAEDVAVAVDAVDAADGRPVLRVAQRTRRGTRRARAGTRASTSSAVTSSAVCGACTSGLSSAGHSPAATRSISARIAIIASTKRSSSPRSSDSVGSIISVPATGNDIVGAWKP